ncbi:MAG: hypothetical protein PHE27_08905 [Alphaproteobacteria bacterium]|nr:hypothetical protein [Alphaproteobacteria bacterium]
MVLYGLGFVIAVMFALLWLVDKYAPLSDLRKNALNSAAFTAVVWLLYAFGVFQPPSITFEL